MKKVKNEERIKKFRKTRKKLMPVFTNLFIWKGLTFLEESSANAWANIDVNVLLPTPPLPDRTRMMFFIFDSFSLMRSISEIEKVIIKIQFFYLSTKTFNESLINYVCKIVTVCDKGEWGGKKKCDIIHFSKEKNIWNANQQFKFWYFENLWYFWG